MKKQLLALSLMVLSIGMFGQSAIWNPFSIQTDTAWGVRYMSAVDTNVMWAATYDRHYTTRTSNRFTRTIDGQNFVAGTFTSDTNYFSISNISAVNDTVAYIAMYSKDATRAGQVIKTIDGGVTWTLAIDTMTMFTGAANFPDVVHFYTNNYGWALGDPNGGGTPAEFEIYRTYNGGTNWTRVPGANIANPASGEYGLTNVYTTYDAANLWFGTNKGNVYRSSDSGKTWLKSGAALAGGDQGLAFRNPQVGFCWGSTSTTSNVYALRLTVNGGATWTPVTVNTTDVGIFDICAVPGRNAFMSVGLNTGSTAYITSVTNDDGATWNVLESGIQEVQRMVKVTMFDSAHGWAGNFSDNQLPLGQNGANKWMGPAITLSCPMYINSALSTVCSGNAVTLTGVGANTYTWSANAGSVTTQTASVSPSTSTVFTVTGSYLTCTNTATFSLTVNTTPTVTAGASPSTICALNSTALTASGATSYNWSPATGLSSTSGANVTGTYSVAGTYTYNVTGTNSGCNGVTTVTVTVLPCVGVNEVSGTIASIYPNPSKGNVTVAFGNVASANKVLVSDMIGNQVLQTSVNAGTTQLSIDLSTMPKGMYLVTVSNATGSSVQKLIIE